MHTRCLALEFLHLKRMLPEISQCAGFVSEKKTRAGAFSSKTLGVRYNNEKPSTIGNLFLIPGLQMFDNDFT